MNIFHLSMECYPVAKVGGLADVVGALPKYQNKINGVDAKVIMPWYYRPFVQQNDFELVFKGSIFQNHNEYQYQILKEKKNILGFELYLVKINHLLDRENPYGYWDEGQQYLSFQHAILHWLCATNNRPDILHCHDYHTGFVPFMINNCPEFHFLKGVKTIGTIHNGEYQGQLHWDMISYFPWIDQNTDLRILDWDGKINPLATLLKTSNAFNTVSEGYLQELFNDFKGLEVLVRQEHQKAFGIVNGIDTEVWNPKTDEFLEHHFDIENVSEGKHRNKKFLCDAFNLQIDLPLFAFIGRFVYEKGADLLPRIIQKSIELSHGNLNFIVLGSGNHYLENELIYLSQRYSNFAFVSGYQEALSHKIYAGSDFLLMPSRVEPCGLNQLYAMRYGTVPIVRYTGGLRDTVADVSSGGAGINFGLANEESVLHSISRAMEIYHQKEYFTELTKNNMKFNYSWEKSAEKYIQMYQMIN